MILSNALVLALDHVRIASLLLHDSRFMAVDHTDNTIQALKVLQENKYDILILQDPLSGVSVTDFLSQVKSSSKSALPRVLLLSAFCHMLKAEYPIDAVISSNDIYANIADAAYSLWQNPVPALCAPSYSKRVDIARQTLQELGMPLSLKGTTAIAFGAAIASCSERNDLPLGQWLYQHIGNMMNSTPANIERNIRSAVEYTWLKGHLPAIHAFFGFSYNADKGKATNAEVIYTLADRIRRLL